MSTTICARDNKTVRYYETALFITAFTDETHELYNDLDYVRRKDKARNAKNENRIYDEQRKNFDNFLKCLMGEEFLRIDAIIVLLKQLNALCTLNYVSVLNLFDQNFHSMDLSYPPSFAPVPLADVKSFLESMYHITADFQITEGMARAVAALGAIQRLESGAQESKEEILTAVKKINTIITRVLTPEIQLNLLRLLTDNLSYAIDKAQYEGKALVAFSSGIRETFESDSQRIKTELQNEMVASEIQRLFEYAQLQQITGYNQDEDAFLQQHTSLGFHWTVPFKVLKSFLVIFFDERAQSLLNDVAIEGFFNNQAYKSEFSSLVYNCCDILTKVRQFENTFTKDGDNYSALIKSYINDSLRDENFLKLLVNLVNTINSDAKNLLIVNCQQLAALYCSAVEIISDVRRSMPAYIANAKVLFSSIRNRDKVEYLESQFPKWNIFFQIMYSYGIVIPPTPGV